MKPALVVSVATLCVFATSCSFFKDASSPEEPASPAGGESLPAKKEGEQTKPVKPKTEAPPLKIPKSEQGKPFVRSQPSALEEYGEWLAFCASESFAKTAQQDQPWTKEAAGFSKAAAQACADMKGALQWSVLANEAQTLAAKGCEDSGVKLWQGESLLRSGKSSLALPYFKKAAVKLQKWDYPKVELALAADGLAETAADDPTTAELAKVALNLAPASMAEAAADSAPYAPESQFSVYEGLLRLRAERSNPKFWRLALASASNINNYPAWLLEALKIRAALEEGKETPLKKAQALAEKFPSRPESHALVLLCMAASPNEVDEPEARKSLQAAINAQVDYLPAYKAYVDFLGAKQGGAKDELLKFGRLCLNSERFDTGVPRMYLDALFKAASNEPSFGWREAFASPGVPEDLEKLYLGLINALPPDDKAGRDALAMERVLLFCWCGDYTQARDLFSKVPAEISVLNEAFSAERPAWKPRSIPELEAEMRAFTGVSKEQFKQWEAALAAGDKEAAFKLAGKLVTMSAGDKPLRALVRSWTVWRLSGVSASQLKPDEEGDPFAFALNGKKPDLIKFLLSNGHEIKRKGYEGARPLLVAMDEALPEETIKLLISRGADVDWRNPETGETPLTLAIGKGYNSAAEFMAEMGSDPNVKLPAGGKTPLHMAASAGSPPLVKTLLRRGAKPNAQDGAGDTPLHCAARAGSLDCVQTLLAKGADASVKNNAGELPLDLAAKRGDEEIQKLLKDAPPPKGKN